MNVRDAVRDVLGVREVRGENEWPSRCFSPQHRDNSPSASVNVDKGVWVCYSCGAGGRLDDLLSGVRIADPDPDRNLVAVDDNLAADVQPREYPAAWAGLYMVGDRHPYWRSRFSDAAIDHFGLGYDYERGCCTYPLRAEGGALLGVVRRNLGDQRPKYVYPKGIKTHDYLFGWEHWPYPYDGPVVLVEGAMDVVALWEAGVPALGIYGSRISDRQSRMVRALNAPYVVCAFDQDDAGRGATERVLSSPVGDSCPVYKAVWEGSAKDVAELSVPERKMAIEAAIPA